MPLQHWYPDTCGCGFAQRHDEGNGVQYEAVLQVCPVHEGLSGSELYDVVHDAENGRKNSVHRELLLNQSLDLAEMKVGRIDTDGRVVPPFVDFKDDVAFSWAFEGTGRDRVLKFSVAGPTVDAKKLEDITTAIEVAVGLDNIAVVDDVEAPVVADEVVPP